MNRYVLTVNWYWKGRGHCVIRLTIKVKVGKIICVRSEVFIAVIMMNTNLLGCDTVESGRSLPTLQRNILLPSSGWMTQGTNAELDGTTSETLVFFVREIAATSIYDIFNNAVICSDYMMLKMAWSVKNELERVQKEMDVA
jgi:hypothetical protein